MDIKTLKTPNLYYQTDYVIFKYEKEKCSVQTDMKINGLIVLNNFAIKFFKLSRKSDSTTK